MTEKATRKGKLKVLFENSLFNTRRVLCTRLGSSKGVDPSISNSRYSDVRYKFEKITYFIRYEAQLCDKIYNGMFEVLVIFFSIFRTVLV